ncbi:amino acid adenylation domain-containing protein [Streptomyces sp. NPDC052292]|uniref:non-ribosomal peptide synthetase n=1 Tax=Streptomyces sp. NPDC052292 TaxID=3155053 RepID=UPI003422E294
MNATTAYWREVLLGGGTVTLPRWSRQPAGTGEHEFTVPVDLSEAMLRLAGTLDADVGTVLLAAHAKAVGALTGEHEVRVGFADREGATPLPCLVDLRHTTWRQLVAHVGALTAVMPRHTDLPAELAGDAPPFETAVGTGEPTAAWPDHPGLPLRIGLARRAGRTCLVLRCRQEVIDADYAARIAGYHLTALRLLTADPDAAHTLRPLLGEEELRFQLDELSGPGRELPDRRVHELIAEVARSRPDAVAAVCGTERLTYQELDDRANQAAHALLAAGLQPEDVVAVVTERNLGWLISLLAILKAGGCYLPVEPQFPAERVTGMLRRAGCGVALVDPAGRGVAEEVAKSLPGLRVRSVAQLLREGHPSSDPGVPVPAGRLAYIYFTSGSTGEPKGVMCEQAGMLNHMLAKVDDLGVRCGTVVAQTAPQCFDISLWQVAAPLLAGGTVVIVPQPVLLDVEEFVAELDHRRIEVIQLVPSYLDVLLTELARHPRELPALRCVSATGEPLKAALVRRWFERFPDVPLVNAYGLTETCDDTNHEVMDRAPDGARVSLGRPVPGAKVYVVDRDLMPVPLGAPGEIVFSGVCISRGYVNDPVRTCTAFPPSPHHRAQRLYRSGDFGRWAPDGRLEFSGRKDAQVKIRGFRIETEEIEDRLLRVPEVREAAVIATGAGEREQRLAAFHSSPPALPVDALADALSRHLPEYMVPADWYWLDTLPLTGNGKVDRKELARIADGLHRTSIAGDEPRTQAERRLAAVWADVLGVPPAQVGRTHDFFGSGGSSLSALRMVIALDRSITLGDVTRRPVLADLARILDGQQSRAGGRLHRLTPPGGPERGALVCFPHAGGNAMNYVPLAKELAGSGWAVHGVEPPGHGLADGPHAEPLVEVAELAEQVAAEVAAMAPGRVLLWGHSAGTACALETARLLRRQGHEVERVFLGAQLPGETADRLAEIAGIGEVGDTEIIARLALESGAHELADAALGYAGPLAASYRHDTAAACRYFVAARQDGRPAIDVPVTVVLADDDEGLDGDPKEWTRFAADVSVRTLEHGGHYFLATRPAEVARIIVTAADPT